MLLNENKKLKILYVSKVFETGVRKHSKFGSPGGGLDKPTDRDQRSWVFLNDPKKYFATNRKPKKILSEKENSKRIPSKILFSSQKSSMIC